MIFGSALAVLAILSIVIYLLIREHGSAHEAASRSASNIVELIDADVLRNVELYDLALQGLIAGSQRDDLLQVSPQIRHLLLFDRATAAPHRSDILLLDANGDVIADSASITPRTFNFADRNFFQKHQQDHSPAMLISRPFNARRAPHELMISFSRRVSSSSGQFLGVAEAAVPLSSFNEMFKKLKIGPDSSINLITAEGDLLAQQPTINPELVGKNFSTRPNFRRFLQEVNGSFFGVSSIDGHQRMYTFSRVGNLPLIVVVALSTDEIYASWRRTTLVVGSATALLCAGLLWLAWLLSRELRLRRHAERDLAALAATDALTGLANRRALDQALKLEWSRTQRSGMPLSVLMIDVDYFKAFNDRHGHQLGDLALNRTAQIIKDTLGRPGDLAARYGGEEFCVVLPEIGEMGALALAEQLRASIERLSPFGDDTQGITASIGAATVVNHEEGSIESLLNAADRALYLAKRTGRNCVVHANETR